MNLHPNIRTGLAAERQSDFARAMCRRRLTVLARQRAGTPHGELIVRHALAGHEPAISRRHALVRMRARYVPGRAAPPR